MEYFGTMLQARGKRSVSGRSEGIYDNAFFFGSHVPSAVVFWAVRLWEVQFGLE